MDKDLFENEEIKENTENVENAENAAAETPENAAGEEPEGAEAAETAETAAASEIPEAEAEIMAGEAAEAAAVDTKKKNSRRSELFAWVRDICIAIVLAFVISMFITPTIVREHSMDDTLHNNDYLILWKMAYKIGQPEYGDIVVFRSDLLDDEGNTKLLIKRVVAVGGDTVAVKDGYVYRNGQKLEEVYTKDGYTNGGIDETVVPEGELFLLGDNRIVSVDSRDPSVGFVEESRLVGKAVLRLYPFDQIGGLYDNYQDE